MLNLSMILVTTQLTLDLPDSCVKHARVQEHTARVFLVLEQIKGNLSNYGNFFTGGADFRAHGSA